MELRYTKEEILAMIQGKWHTLDNSLKTEFIGYLMSPIGEEITDNKNKIDLKWDEEINKWRLLYTDFFWNITTIEDVTENSLIISITVKLLHDGSLNTVNYIFLRG